MGIHRVLRPTLPARPESDPLVRLERTRRQALRDGLLGLGLLIGTPFLPGCGSFGSSGGLVSNIANLGPLLDADENGLRLPSGFTSRVVARSTQLPVATSATPWHRAPDGGATFAMWDGGWVYVSNSEVASGGVGALRFAEDGSLIDAYSLLSGTTNNCAGGKTPWGTWLSCEEHGEGRVHECDPLGRVPAIARPALGVFKHEAAAVDPSANVIYMTEDEPDGNFYRFRPHSLRSDGHPDLMSGTLEVAEVNGKRSGPVVWHPLPDPSAAKRETREQVEAATAFKGGEGICMAGDAIYFATKGDDRVWRYDPRAEKLAVAYAAKDHEKPRLKGVDNLVASGGGDVLVAEDKGDMEIVALTPSGGIVPVVQVVGHGDSEITGPAFSPSGTRLYFSSQKGTTGSRDDGVTFEITGPFHI